MTLILEKIIGPTGSVDPIALQTNNERIATQLNGVFALAEGNVMVGDSSGNPSDVDASGDAKILVGDGTTVASVAVSGDVTIDNTGAVTISAVAVETSMIALDAIDNTLIADNAISLENLDAAITPSHITVYAGEVTWTGSGASLAATVAGVLSTDIVLASIQTVPTEAGYLVSAAATDDTITAVLSAANTSNDAVISYQVLRAAA